jgi:hypothetical protein
MHRFRLCILMAFAVAPSVAFAHHGQDFLLLESPTVPHPGSIYLIANSHVALERDAEERAAIEPALIFGISPRFAFELHAHEEKLAGEPWTYEATAPAIHVLFTDPDRHDGLKIGLSAEYEIAAEHGAADNTELRLSFEKGSEQDKWAGNLIASREQGGETDFGAALGFRHEIHEGFALGVEGQSSFQRAEDAQLVAGAYFENEQSWTIKLGIGGQRESDGHISAVAHFGLVLRLR